MRQTDLIFSSAEQALKARKEIADYIKGGRIERARIRVSRYSIFTSSSSSSSSSSHNFHDSCSLLLFSLSSPLLSVTG